MKHSNSRFTAPAKAGLGPEDRGTQKKRRSRAVVVLSGRAVTTADRISEKGDILAFLFSGVINDYVN
jgi:hypothetical protein